VTDNAGTWRFLRLDHQASGSDRLFFRFAQDPLDPNSHGPFKGTKGEVADPYEQTRTLFSNTLGASWTRLISNRTVNEFNFGYTNFALDWKGGSPEALNQNWASKLGLKNLAPDTFPHIDLAGYGPFGGGTWVQQLVYDSIRAWSFYDTLNHQRGRHNLRIGGGWKHSKAVYASRFWPSGLAGFDTRATALPGVAGTGNSVASALLGQTANAQVQESPASDMRTWFVTGFLQDDFRITKSLTLNLGVRYEYDKPKVDVTEGTNSFNFNSINPVCGCPGVITFGINSYTLTLKHTPLYYQPPLDFAPRVGFAWSPGGRSDLVVRGGYGMFYIGGDYGDVFWNGPLLGRGTIQNWISDAQGLTPAFVFSQGFPVVPVQALNNSWGAVPVGQAPVVSPQFFWYDRKAGYAQQFNLGIQKQVGRNLIELAYLGNAVKKLPGPEEFNQVPTQLLGPGNAQVLRPFPQFGSVLGWGVNRYSSLYNSGFISLRREFSSGLTIQTSYTLARQLDNLGPEDTYNLRGVYGPSSLQRHHRFVWASVYELPFGKNKSLLNSGVGAAVLGGWSLTSLIQAQSGAPFSIASIVNTCNCFSQGNQGVNIIGSPNTHSNSGFDPTKTTWFDPNAFQFAAPYTFGNAGKGILTAPMSATVDLTIDKRFPLTERIKLEVRGEAFNALDRVNLNAPNTTFGSPSFGRITAAGDPRRIQLGAKLYF
jgi:hypothetical protein